MLSPRSRNYALVALALLAGAALRLWFIRYYPVVEGDTFLYGDIAKNWMLHGVYGLSAGGSIHPTLIRLPGYPLFLILCFRLFGLEHYNAVMFLQTALDLATCLLVAAFARRIWSTRAAWLALWLSALCPFTANYAAAPLSETPELFCTALGFYAFVRMLDVSSDQSAVLKGHGFSRAVEDPKRKGALAPEGDAARRRKLTRFSRLSWCLVLAFAWSYAALLRPDGALLAVALFSALILYAWRMAAGKTIIRLTFLAALLSILPFIAWTIRNQRTFHIFQPLAPRYAVDPGESPNRGFIRWTKSICADLACTSDVYWNANDDVIDIGKLPSRAFDSRAQYEQTRRLLAAYNRTTTLTPQLDAAFGALAAQRIHDHPFRYYIVLPLARLADMALRPRTANLWIELRWWQFSHHEAETEFSFAYASLNFAYFVAALIGFLKRPPFRGAILAFVLLRCALLLTLEAPEPRYTLEWFPPLIALAAIALAGPQARPSSEEHPSSCAHPAHLIADH